MVAKGVLPNLKKGIRGRFEVERANQISAWAIFLGASSVVSSSAPILFYVDFLLWESVCRPRQERGGLHRRKDHPGSAFKIAAAESSAPIDIAACW